MPEILCFTEAWEAGKEAKLNGTPFTEAEAESLSYI
ncbi:hypothetical protein Vi05172_g3454 [Venturia inaequalis]|nr:hypothetical protein Vi05172_g3454 [Venturia inaequalis]